MRTNKLAAILAIVIAFVLGLILTSCSGTANEATPAVTVTVTAQPSDTTAQDTHEAVPNTTVDQDGATASDLDSYLTSVERARRYEAFATEAGVVIAQALNTGYFGDAYRYTDMKEPRPDGYVGWGGITTTASLYRPPGIISSEPFAWVYWNADGTIDTTKSIMDLSISDKADPENTKVLLFDPIENGWWSASFFAGSSETTIPFSNPVSYYGWGHKYQSGQYTVTQPLSLQGYKEFDDIVLEQLETNMVSWFGDDWRNDR